MSPASMPRIESMRERTGAIPCIEWAPILSEGRSSTVERKPHAPGYALFLVSLVALATVLVERSPIRTFQVISRSMMPTVTVGDRVVAISCDLLPRALDVGDLVTFHPPSWIGSDPPVLKRVVGLGGDILAIRNGSVFVNHRRLIEPYAHRYAAGYRFGPIQIPPGTVFVLGDNRRISEDSTTFGPVPVPRIDSIAWLQLGRSGSACSLAGSFPGLSEC